jgi:hypothetical protein
VDFQEYANSFGVDEHEFKDIMARIFNQNISALAFFEGYISEYFLEKLVVKVPGVSGCTKPGDNNTEIIGNVKRKTNTYRQPKQITNLEESYWLGNFCTRAGRSRNVTFSDGSTVHTYNTKRGQYDVIAVNVFRLTGVNQFAYCLETDLPSTTISSGSTLTPLQCNETLRGDMWIRWPVAAPWTDSLEEILERAHARSTITV